MTHLPRSSLIFLLCFVAASSRGQVVPAEKSPPDNNFEPFFSGIRGLFDFDLPSIDPPGTVKLILHPHFGDLIRRDYMRVEGGLRWALSDHFELRPEASVYFPHGFGDTNNDGYGIGELRLAGKYILHGWPTSNKETSLTLNIERPVGDPPVDLTDGLNHFAPGFLVQHHSTRNYKLTTFFGAGLDLVSVSDVAGTPVRNQPLDDSLNFTAGVIYDLGQVKWTLTATYATTAGLADATEHFYYLRPNVLWYVPRKYTFNSKTQWIL
ncbi:MAG TPA: hypothetical protein VHS96_11000, partial [Bacteroidia bacterium]|nr:hypothetical protein [Bacteroidia bacterium]